MFITLILFEIYFRNSESILPSVVIDDTILGRNFSPEREYLFLKEGFGIGKVNASGYLGEEYEVKKDTDAIRVALFGDSFVEGFQLPDKLGFRKKTEELLFKLTGRKSEVFNFGMSGFDFERMFIKFSKYSYKYDPDVLVFFVRNINFQNTDNSLGPQLTLTNDTLNYDGSFNNTKSFNYKIKFAFTRDYSFYSLFQNTYYIYSNDNIKNYIPTGWKCSINDNKNGSNATLCSWLNIDFHKTKLIIKELCKEKRNGKKILFAELDKVDDEINEYILSQNIQVINLDKIFIEKGFDSEALNYWKGSKRYGHFNYFGHQVIGEILANTIYKYYYE